MTNAAMKAIREIATSPTTTSARPAPMTAREMALSAHTLSPNGEFAIFGGFEWIWSKHFGEWRPWKRAAASAYAK